MNLIRMWCKFSAQKFHLCLAWKIYNYYTRILNERKDLFFRNTKHFHNYASAWDLLLGKNRLCNRSNNSFESKIYLGKSATPRIQLLWNEETGCGRPAVRRTIRRSRSRREGAAARLNSSLALITLGRLLSIMSGNRWLTQFRTARFVWPADINDN